MEGITLFKNAKGKATHARIDLVRWKDRFWANFGDPESIPHCEVEYSQEGIPVIASIAMDYYEQVYPFFEADIKDILACEQEEAANQAAAVSEGLAADVVSKILSKAREFLGTYSSDGRHDARRHRLLRIGFSGFFSHRYPPTQNLQPTS